jgi:hypothetical protein
VAERGELPADFVYIHVLAARVPAADEGDRAGVLA